MEITFRGKRALVTGASKGIGRAVAIQLAKCGADVVAVGRSLKDLESLKADVVSIQTIALDLADWNATRKALKDIGPIDLLVNNAGLAIVKPLIQLSKEDIDSMFDINIKAAINVSQLVAEDLLKRKAPGSIVNTSSLASLVGVPNFSVYCATKGALDAFTRAAALELGPHNIRVNSVNPTIVLTEMGRNAWRDPVVLSKIEQATPLRRLCEIQEVADAIVFLLSDKASMITGTCLPVDGGYVAT